MLNLPYQSQLRAHYLFPSVFMLHLMWNVVVIGIIILAIAIILFTLSKCLKKAAQPNDSLLENHQEEGWSADDEQVLPTVLRVITNVFFLLWLVHIVVMVALAYGFGTLGRGMLVDVLVVLGMFLLLSLPTVAARLCGKGCMSAVGVWLELCVCVGLMIVCKDMCLCFYNQRYQMLYFQTQLSISTQLSRSYYLSTVCEEQQLCHVYATLPHDTATQVFINAHTGLGIHQISVRLSQADHLFIQENDNPTPVLDVDEVGRRNIFSVYFQHLTPNTMYKLTVLGRGTANWTVLHQTQYLTLPQNTSEVRMAIGGDVGFHGDADILTSHLVKYDPHVIIVGGDITYDDGMRSCYYCWDNFYAVFQVLNVKLHRLVPLILGIGNHDVGYDALSSATISKSPDNIPYYFLYNPQHQHNRAVPPIAQRSSYHAHVIGSTLHLMLDSGYMQSHEGQKRFLQEMSKQHQGLAIFANYHNPIYPSCRDHHENSNDEKVKREGLEHWVPLFEKYGFVGAFEHHTHYRKVTHPLKNGKVREGGVRYVGDGSWGVPQFACSQDRVTQHPELFAHIHNKNNPNHVWEVTVNTNDTHHIVMYEGIDLAGEVIFAVQDTFLTSK